MNSLNIVGRIGRVSDVNQTKSGKSVMNFTVAVDNGKNKSTNEQYPATWFEVTLWEKVADNLAQYLRKGDRVAVSGKAGLKVDKGKDGEVYPKLTIEFPYVELLGNKRTEPEDGGDEAETEDEEETASRAGF